MSAAPQRSRTTLRLPSGHSLRFSGHILNSKRHFKTQAWFWNPLKSTFRFQSLWWTEWWRWQSSPAPLLRAGPALTWGEDTGFRTWVQHFFICLPSSKVTSSLTVSVSSSVEFVSMGGRSLAFLSVFSRNPAPTASSHSPLLSVSKFKKDGLALLKPLLPANTLILPTFANR